MKSTFLSRFIVKRPWLLRWALPLAEWYHTKMGYRQLGLRYEDLLMEESEVVQLALKRLPPREAYDRVFRIRRAFQVWKPMYAGHGMHLLNLVQLTMTHQILPEEEWTPVEEVRSSICPDSPPDTNDPTAGWSISVSFDRGN